MWLITEKSSSIIANVNMSMYVFFQFCFPVIMVYNILYVCCIEIKSPIVVFGLNKYSFTGATGHTWIHLIFTAGSLFGKSRVDQSIQPKSRWLVNNI